MCNPATSPRPRRKQLAVGAGRDINLLAGMETGSAYDEVRYKTRSFLSSKTTHTITSSDWEQAKGSTFTGDTAVLVVGRDLNVVGSKVAAQKEQARGSTFEPRIAGMTGARQVVADGFQHCYVFLRPRRLGLAEQGLAW